MEFRCPSRLHFIETNRYVEVKCKSKRCGAISGTIVLHRFRRHTGELIETIRLQDPAKFLVGREGRNKDASQHHPAAVRSS